MSPLYRRRNPSGVVSPGSSTCVCAGMRVIRLHNLHIRVQTSTRTFAGDVLVDHNSLRPRLRPRVLRRNNHHLKVSGSPGTVSHVKKHSRTHAYPRERRCNYCGVRGTGHVRDLIRIEPPCCGHSSIYNIDSARYIEVA